MQETRPAGRRLDGVPSLLVLGGLGVFGGEIGATKYGEDAGGRFALALFVAVGSASRVGISTTGREAGADFDGVVANSPFTSRC
jgi:hypothetical protein